jgi:hypothetical protein
MAPWKLASFCFPGSSWKPAQEQQQKRPRLQRVSPPYPGQGEAREPRGGWRESIAQEGEFSSAGERRLFNHQELKVIIGGLDNGEKTPILYQFSMNVVVHTSPTTGSNVEEIVINNAHFLMWDVGGQESFVLPGALTVLTQKL